MSTSSVTDGAWAKYPFTFRNNRGTALTKDGRFIRFGLPEPTAHETDESMKGSDRIGFHEITITPDMIGKKIAVFTGIEIKGKGDRLKPGQKRWHEFLLDHGAISEIWIEKPDGTIEIIKERIDETS